MKRPSEVSLNLATPLSLGTLNVVFGTAAEDCGPCVIWETEKHGVDRVMDGFRFMNEVYRVVLSEFHAQSVAIKGFGVEK